MKIWLIFNSIGLLTIGAVLYLTIRQVGLILGRLGPIGARSASDVGPRVGENLSPFLEPHNATIKNGKPTLYVFGSDTCGICARISLAAESLANYWSSKSNIVLIYDPLPNASSGNNAVSSKGNLSLLRSQTLRHEAGVNLVPFGVIVDSLGVVMGKGLVNDISHLESLLEITTKP